jgi:NADH-quinone oxidoreductase subunit C
MNKKPNELSEYVEYILRNDIKETKLTDSDYVIKVAPSSLIKTVTFLRDDNVCLFGSISDILVVDNPLLEHRFSVYYNLISYHIGQRIMIEVPIKKSDTLKSISHLIPGAKIMEREVCEMFGIKFSKNDSLKALYLCDSVEAPLMKKNEEYDNE